MIWLIIIYLISSIIVPTIFLHDTQIRPQEEPELWV